LTQSVLSSDPSHVPCPAVTFSNIRLSNDVHGRDWSWKSLILGEKETGTDRNIVVLISSVTYSVICVINCSDCVPYKLPCPSKYWRHWYTSSVISRMLEQIVTIKKRIRPVKECNIDLRSSGILRSVDSQSLLTEVSTAYRSHLQGSNIFLDCLTL
jgi:hypothetical protein